LGKIVLDNQSCVVYALEALGKRKLRRKPFPVKTLSVAKPNRQIERGKKTMICKADDRNMN